MVQHFIFLVENKQVKVDIKLIVNMLKEYHSLIFFYNTVIRYF